MWDGAVDANECVVGVKGFFPGVARLFENIAFPSYLVDPDQVEDAVPLTVLPPACGKARRRGQGPKPQS